MSETPDQALQLALAHLDKQFGKGSVMKLSDPPQKWPALSTGSLSLDLALGIGGWPLGRVVELFGAESTGKSTLCLQVIAEAQKLGGKCLFVDAEHALDPFYAQALGVNLDELMISQPTTGEEAIDVLEVLVKTGSLMVAVVDSVAALVPQDELEGDMAKQHMGLQARLMSKAMRKIPGAASRSNTLVIFTNQLREKVGIVFGNPVTQPGGRALKFYATTRVELARAGDVKEKSDGESVGIRIRAKIPKNKVASPLKVCEYDILYGKGVDLNGEIVDIAADRGIIKKAGAWYSYDGKQIGQGRQNTIAYLNDNPELANRIKKEILGK